MSRDKDHDDIIVDAGSARWRGREEKVMSKIVFHKDYKVNHDKSVDLTEYRWNLALIKVSENFTRHLMDDRSQYLINTVCLPKDAVIPNGRTEKATFFGFGWINNKAVLIGIMSRANPAPCADGVTQDIHWIPIPRAMDWILEVIQGN